MVQRIRLKISSRVVFVMAMVIAAFPAHSENHLGVTFEYEGESHSIQGEPVGTSRFVFNKGGSPSIRIATLDWPPYIGQNICGQGWVQQLSIALFASQGYEVESAFLPWARALREVETGYADVIYPLYYQEPDARSQVRGHEDTRRLDHIHQSAEIPGGPVAFMKRAGDDIPFDGSFTSLEGERIGVVRGYQNTPEFDRLMEEGFFDIDTATDDLENARKLAGNRTDLLVGDPSVILFAVANADLPETERREIADSIVTVEPVLEYKHLYYGVSRHVDNSERIRRDLARAIVAFTETGELLRIISDVSDRCGYETDDTLAPYLVD